MKKPEAFATSQQSPSMAVLVAKVSILAETNREAYRELRKVMWQFVVENSSRSDFPSEMS